MLYIRILRRITRTRYLPPHNPPSPPISTRPQLRLLDVQTTRRFLIRAHVPQMLALHVAELAFRGRDEVRAVRVGASAEL